LDRNTLLFEHLHSITADGPLFLNTMSKGNNVILIPQKSSYSRLRSCLPCYYPFSDKSRIQVVAASTTTPNRYHDIFQEDSKKQHHTQGHRLSSVGPLVSPCKHKQAVILKRLRQLLLAVVEKPSTCSDDWPQEACGSEVIDQVAVCHPHTHVTQPKNMHHSGSRS
jgi:hypothetical protein